jgi:hypothetical protein
MQIMLNSIGIPKEKFYVYILLSSLIVCHVSVFGHLNIGGEDTPITFEDKMQIGIGVDKDEKEIYIKKRMVDFISKRVLLLEKVLNVYHKMFLVNWLVLNMFDFVLQGNAMFHKLSER